MISAARPEELGEALTLLFGNGQRAAQACQLIARGEWNRSDLLVARSDKGLCGAILCQQLPGSTALLWPARTSGDDPSIGDALTKAAIEHAAGAKVIQAFLLPDEAECAATLTRAGFQRITQVLEMKGHAAWPDELRAHLKLTPYQVGDQSLFEQILHQSHEDSLDCPELNGIRTPAEVVAGYRDCAPDLNRWWLAYWLDKPAGVLILSDAVLVFVGVVPSQRGRGIGRALVEAACSKTANLSLVVDIRNAPAVQLYLSMGFDVVGAREVFLNFSQAVHV